MSNFVKLEFILGKDQEELTALKVGEFDADKLGTVPFTALEHDEYKHAKKDCIKMVPNGTGGMTPDIDDDRLMIKIIIDAVDKDKRSNFTFANKQLMEKVGAVTAEGVVKALLSPGEIVSFAMEIQDVSGFGQKAKKETAEAVKNS